jgi:cystathionine beta-lyase
MTIDGHGRFIFDEGSLEKALDDAEKAGIRVPLAFFCSPHNPGGRVWTGGEIESFLNFAKRRGMIVTADEIHGDFVYKGNFVSTSSFEKYADRIITLSGATKSFNLGGLHASHCIIRDEKLRVLFRTAFGIVSNHECDVFAERAAETCYRRCAPWLDELKNYILKNLEEASAFLATIPGIKAWVPDGTYLLWADVRALVERNGMQNDVELVNHLEKEARVKITHGRLYGKAGAGFVRINAASPRPLLTEALRRIKNWACM